MTKKHSLRFADSVAELSKTVTAFNVLSGSSKRSLVGNNPIYFVHVKRGNKHLFCVSKACYVTDFQYSSYLENRDDFGGGGARHQISYITDTAWISYLKTHEEVRLGFKEWIREFFPNYKIRRARIISLNQALAGEREVKKRALTIKDLKERLKNQAVIGEIGEEIVYNSELTALKNKKDIDDPEKYVKLQTKKYVNAGFDIKSYDHRLGRPKYIEVKSTTVRGNREFYISRNELEFLQGKGTQGYIYFVHVTDIDKREGKIVKRLQNPVPKLNLTADSYVGRIN